MSLRAKLSFAFVGLALVTLAVTFVVLMVQLQGHFAAQFEARSALAGRAVRQSLEQMAGDMRLALKRLEAEPLVVELAADLRNGAFYGHQDRERHLVKAAPALMVAPQFDVLRIVDAGQGGRVLALGHRRGAEPPDARAVAVAERYPDAFLFRDETVQPAGAPATEKWLTLQVPRRLPGGVVLVAGRRLDRAFLERVAGSIGYDVQLRLADVAGRTVAHTFARITPPAPDDPAFRQHTLRFVNPDVPREGIQLTVYVPTAPLRENLEALVRFAVVLGGAALLLACLLAWTLAGGVTRPLRQLVAGVERVAAGDLDHRIPVRTRDEVGRLVERFNRMTAEIASSRERLLVAERMAAWKDIARQIAHEIKNPLFPIQTSIETLRKAHARQHPRFAEILDESTKTTLEEVQRLKRIVDEFSAFARMPKPRVSLADVHEVVRSVARLYGPAEANVELRLVLHAEPVNVPHDADLFGQALANIVRNATQALAGRPDGLVRIATRPLAGGGACIEIDDNGPGIAPEDRARVFEPYFTRKAEGTGLGLAIVYRTIVEHGGTVRAEASPLGGARFVVELPGTPTAAPVAPPAA